MNKTSSFLIIAFIYLLSFSICCNKVEKQKFNLPSDSLVCSVVNSVMEFNGLYSEDSIPVFYRIGVFSYEREIAPPPKVFSKVYTTEEIQNLFERVNYQFKEADSIYLMAQSVRDSVYSRRYNLILSKQFVLNYKIANFGYEGRNTKNGKKLIVFHKPLFTNNNQYAFIQYDIIDGFYMSCFPDKTKEKSFPAYRLILKKQGGKWLPLLYDKLR
jgi:hypothetical protein